MRRLLATALLVTALLPTVVFAQINTGDTGLHETGENVFGPLSGDSASLGTFLGERVINPFFGVLGVIFLVLMIYGGIRWMTAGGEAGSVEKAKGIITRAVLGLLVILLAYGFTQFIFSAITQPGGTP